jgi:tRNA A37 threonylcarbamoyltransferase TsaD
VPAGGIQLVDMVLPTRQGIENHRRCVTQPSDHQAILLRHLRLNLPAIRLAGGPGAAMSTLVGGWIRRNASAWMPVLAIPYCNAHIVDTHSCRPSCRPSHILLFAGGKCPIITGSGITFR